MGRAPPHTVQQMFDRIARRYDAFNTVASLGRDEAWRRLCARLAAPSPVEHGLDAATGTARLAAALAARARRVTALDFAPGMMSLARDYLRRRGLQGRVDLAQGDVLALPFRSGVFDCATIGFGVRNLADIPGGLAEFRRVLRPGGRLVVLDIVKPRHLVQRAVYAAVFKRLLPLVGWALSGDREAYRYLPSSVDRHLSPRALVATMEGAGFRDVGYRTLFLGTIALHWGTAGDNQRSGFRPGAGRAAGPQ